MKEQNMQYNIEFQALFDLLPGGIQKCLNDEFFTITECNQGFVDLFGFSRSELADKFNNHFCEMIHPDDCAQIVADIAKLKTDEDRFKHNYRVLCKDGTYKWITDNARLIHTASNEELIYCVLLDASDPRRIQHELQLSLEGFHAMINRDSDIIFEWNIAEKSVIFSNNWIEKFGIVPQHKDLQDEQAVFSNVHPDDAHIIRSFADNIQQNHFHLDTDLRLRDKNGKYIWCHIRLAGQFDHNGNPLTANGIISDIDEERRLLEDLRYQAERDALTGLYNRLKIQQQIQSFLSENAEGSCALLMIDADNFKQINDVQGHLFGDAVLTEMAVAMKRLTRPIDFVGRVGGDEFAIFLPNLPYPAYAEEIAQKLLDAILHLLDENKQTVHVGCSIGVAICPESGSTFAELYHSADLALYQAKKLGKNRYMRYDETCLAPESLATNSCFGTAIDSDLRTQRLPADLVIYVFQALYATKDIASSLQMILEIVGKRFDVSRAYIFENSADNKFCDNTYEWCNIGITPQKEQLQHCSFTQFGNYVELFRDNSIFYCQDITRLTPVLSAFLAEQGICSTLQCAILENGNFSGFVGFDECTGIRMWTQEEIAVLSLISQILTTFLLKKRAAERDRKQTELLNAILDAQNAYVYAIDQKTYELLYLNRKTLDLDPTAQIGTPCYQAFFGNQKPCRSCPINGVTEIYNPQYDVWSDAHLTRIQWDGRDVYLLSCYDITKYKRLQKKSKP